VAPETVEEEELLRQPSGQRIVARGDKELYAIRDKQGRYKDVQSYNRAHGQDVKRRAKTESKGKRTATDRGNRHYVRSGIAWKPALFLMAERVRRSVAAIKSIGTPASASSRRRRTSCIDQRFGTLVRGMTMARARPIEGGA
jgi:hypothetical protein